MALEGSIKDFGLPDIIQFLRQQNKTGVLTISTHQESSRILFEEGKIVDASKLEGDETKVFIDQLIEAEIVTEEVIRGMAEVNSDQAGLEKALLETGTLTPDLLKEFLTLNTRETIYLLFRLEEGKYSFETLEHVRKPGDVTPMEADFVLLEGMRQFDEWPSLRNKIKSNNMIVERVTDVKDKIKVAAEKEMLSDEPAAPEPSGGAIVISAEEKAIYDRIDGNRDVAKIVALSRLGEFETVKGLVTLLSQGLIAIVGEKAPGVVPVAEAIVETKTEKKGSTVAIAKLGWNTAVYILAVLSVIVLGKGIRDSFLPVLELPKILDSDLITVERLELQEAITIYTLRNLQTPTRAEDLIGEIKGVERIIEDLKNYGIRDIHTSEGVNLKLQ